MSVARAQRSLQLLAGQDSRRGGTVAACQQRVLLPGSAFAASVTPLCLARPRNPKKEGVPKLPSGYWKQSKSSSGNSLKATKLINTLASLSDVKEDVYGALDAWCAFEIDFPVAAVRKAMQMLKERSQWKRIIQVSKWMMSKGHGKTMATYYLLLQSLEQEGRIEEAEELFQEAFRRLLDALPRSHFKLMLMIYKRAGLYDKLLELFADMEELRVKPDLTVVDLVAEVYALVGMPDKSAMVRLKYPPERYEYRYVRGKRMRRPIRFIYGDKAVDLMHEKLENSREQLQ